MAVSVTARCSPGLGAAVSGSRRPVRAQPCKTPFGCVRIARPQMLPTRAFYRAGNCYNNWDEEAMKRMMSEVEDMAKQWKETGKMSGGFFWPGGGYIYAAGKSRHEQPANGDSSKPITPSLALDVVSTDGFYLVYADVPGLAKADLTIKLSKDRVLTVSGERKPPVEEGFTQKERAFAAFSRSWTLPEDGDSEGISAKVTEGVLTITVPKKQPEPEVDDAQDITIN